MEARALEAAGYGGRPLPCVLYETGAERAAVVLPGNARAGHRLGGTPARPDLHFTRALLLESGLDVLEAWWDGDSRPDPPGERERWYRESALAATRAAGESRVALLVGRSMGTAGLSFLPELSHLPSIWIAPLTTVERVRSAVEGWRGPVLVVAGEADEAFAPVAGERIELVSVPGADHGLDVGDAATSARALADVLDRMRDWLRRVV